MIWLAVSSPQLWMAGTFLGQEMLTLLHSSLLVGFLFSCSRRGCLHQRFELGVRSLRRTSWLLPRFHGCFGGGSSFVFCWSWSAWNSLGWYQNLSPGSSWVTMPHVILRLEYIHQDPKVLKLLTTTSLIIEMQYSIWAQQSAWRPPLWPISPQL